MSHQKLSFDLALRLQEVLGWMYLNKKSFLRERETVSIGYSETENVCILVGRGVVADLLEEISVRIHQEIANVNKSKEN